MSNAMTVSPGQVDATVSPSTPAESAPPASEVAPAAAPQGLEDRSPDDRARDNWEKKFERQEAREKGRDIPGTPSQDIAEANEADTPQEQAAADAIAEIVWNDGKTYQVPGIFKDVLTKADSLDRDYTQKSQRFAAERTEVENTLKDEYRRMELQREHIGELAEAQEIQKRLKEYETVDFNAWAQQDPSAAQRHQVLRGELEKRVGHISQIVEKNAMETMQRERSEESTAIAQAQAQIVADIPGWNKEVADEISNFSRKELLIPNEVLQGLNQFPWAVKALHMAMGHHKSLQAALPSNQPKPTPTPVPKVGGSAVSTVTDPDQLSTKDWMKRRNAQISRMRKEGANIR